MPLRVEIRPELLVWARERSRLSVADLAHRFPRLREWESGGLAPTLKQLESFAQATHTPIGYLFLAAPPHEAIPIPDFRTMAGTESPAPSPDLLDTVYLCEQRQAWYRNFARENREPSLALRTLTTQTPVAEAGAVMRQALSFDIGERGSSWGGALRMLIENAEALGVLVMVSGIVGSNTHRKLDPREFRGFALADELAPLIFVNGTDTKAAQIFTVAHELAHIWLGVSGVSNAEVTTPSGPQIERWCNQVAAEMLVPLAEMQPAFQVDADLTEELDRLARLFRVSTLVVLRRVHDAGYLSLSEYASAYAAELERVINFLATRVESSGGNFYNTQPVRVSKRFARAMITSTLEGNTLYRDAFQMLGFKKYSTFNELASRLGVGQ